MVANAPYSEHGGDGGGLVGGDGGNCSGGGPGLGGTQTSGGNGGVASSATGGNGVFGIGGSTNASCCGGGGGGGYYGGGSGAYTAGGGGSSYTIPTAFNIIHAQGVNSGNGYLTIETACISGCTDSLALNYNQLAVIDNNSCCYDCGKIEGFVYEDADTSATYDSIVENPLGTQIIQLSKSNGKISYLTTQSDGYYSFIVDQVSK